MINPVEDLKFMRSILLNIQSLMSHSTGCYNYKYEYTRFHTHFFLGDSVKIMSKESGLKIVDFCDDVKANDFICYVYAPDGEINLTDKGMFPNILILPERKTFTPFILSDTDFFCSLQTKTFIFVLS